MNTIYKCPKCKIETLQIPNSTPEMPKPPLSCPKCGGMWMMPDETEACFRSGFKTADSDIPTKWKSQPFCTSSLRAGLRLQRKIQIMNFSLWRTHHIEFNETGYGQAKNR